MEPWFAEAKRITSLDAKICFLLQHDFYYGPDSHPEVVERKEVEPLPSPNIARQAPSMVCSAEALGHEEELAHYYREVVRIARKHRQTFNAIRHYFWLRFWLWNSEQDVHIAFPWYDTFGEIEQILDSVAKTTEGQVFWDVDQGWELEMYSSEGELFTRLRDPDYDETHVVVRFPREMLLEQLQPVRTRTESIIRFLSSAIGQDVWTKHVEWPDFCPPDSTETGSNERRS